MPTKVIINCSLIVSKKIEALLEQGETISLSVGPIKGNKAPAQLAIVINDKTSASAIGEIKETSLIISNLSVSDEITTAKTFNSQNGVCGIFTEEEPSKATEEQEDLFSKTGIGKVVASNPNVQYKTAATVAKLQTATPPMKNLIVQKPTVQLTTQQTPKAYAAIGSQSATKAMSYDNLVTIINGIPNVDTIKDPRLLGKELTRAESLQLEAELATAPRLPFSVYVKNCTGGHLNITDIDLKFTPNEVVDISRIPVVKIKISRDLAWCFRTKKVVFSDEQEFVDWVEGKGKVDDTRTWIDDVKVFHDLDEAKAEMGTKFAGFDAPVSYRSPRIVDGPKELVVTADDRMDIEADENVRSGFVMPEEDMGGLIGSLPESRSGMQASGKRKPEPAKTITHPKIKRTGIQNHL